MATLDYLEAAPLTLERIAGLRVLRKDWASFRGDPARCFVDVRVPWWLERVGAAPEVERFGSACQSYSSWETVFSAFTRASWLTNGRATRALDRAQVPIDVGGGPVLLRRDAYRVTLGPMGELVTPREGRVRWNALDVLDGLTELTYTGTDATVLDYVASRGLSHVTLHAHGQRIIDLRASRVEALTLDVHDAEVVLHPPPSLRRLTVLGQSERLVVEGARTDFPFWLRFAGPRIMRPPRGTEDVQKVEYFGLMATDTAGLEAYTRLAELTLRGAPGRLHDAAGLDHVVSTLRELEVHELYALDGARWPMRWPSLDGAALRGLARSDADAIRGALADVASVRMNGVRTNAWIEANLDNPFRSWDEDDTALGRGACAAWKTARTRADALGLEADLGAAEATLRGLVDRLNRLDARHGLDTVRREEAAEAFFALARAMGVEDARAEAWLEAWRAF